MSALPSKTLNDLRLFTDQPSFYKPWYSKNISPVTLSYIGGSRHRRFLSFGGTIAVAGDSIKMYNNKRLCFSITANEIQYAYISYYNRFEFREKCKKLHPQTSQDKFEKLNDLYIELGKNVTNTSPSIHKIIPLGKMFTDMKESKNFSVIPMNAFGLKPTLDQWSQQLHQTYASVLHKEKKKFAQRKPRDIRDDPIDLQYLNDQIAYEEEKIENPVKTQLNKNFHYLKGYECNRPVHICCEI